MSRVRNVGFDDLQAFIRQYQGASPEEFAGLATDLREVIVGDRSLNSVFPDVQTGTLQEELGDVSSDELSDLLQTIDSIAEVGTGDSSSGGGQSDRATRVRSQVTRTITELQANQLLAFQQEQVFSLRNIEAVLRNGLNVPDSIGAVASQQASGGGATYNVQIDVNSDMPADEVARKLENAIQQMN
jgi:hypothetical protein